MGRVHNFAAGPAALPLSVLEACQAEFTDYDNTGMSVFELSHRSKPFDAIIKNAEAKLRRILGVPATYKVLFMQGGATGQFSAVPMNLIARSASQSADYVVTGQWSTKAVAEAQKYGTINEIASTKSSSFTTLPPPSSWSVNKDASYLYYCANETVHGVEFPSTPIVPDDAQDVPLVADMCSNLLARPVDVAKHGVIFAGAQKNIAPSGLTVTVIREDLLGHKLPYTPVILDYEQFAKSSSLYHTPATYSIYMADKVFDWIDTMGGLEGIAARNDHKAEIVYSAVDGSAHFAAPVAAAARSKMNVVFKFADDKHKDKESDFLEKAAKQGLVQLAGHRSVGGFRASLYNATGVEAAEALAAFIKEYDATLE